MSVMRLWKRKMVVEKRIGTRGQVGLGGSRWTLVYIPRRLYFPTRKHWILNSLRPEHSYKVGKESRFYRMYTRMCQMEDRSW